jgi:hypothetical protein
MANKRGFVMTPKSILFGLHEGTSDFGTPVIKKDDLDPGVQAEANRDGTIFVDSNLSDDQIKTAVKHEKVHLDQIKQGRLQYTDDSVIWKRDTKSPAKVYRRIDMNEGHPDFEWEKEAYKKE